MIQFLFVLLCSSTLLASTFVFANTHNNLMPNARLFLAPATQNNTDALSVMGEVGPRNFRGNITYGRAIDPCQRYKLSGEYLTQRLNYHFKSGDAKRWVSQVGIGGSYQYLLKHSRFQSIDADLAYAHAFHRDLHKKHIFEHGQIEILKRRIASSDSIFSFLGTTLELYKCSFLSFGVNYDFVLYHRVFQHKVQARGFGGTAKYQQQFAKHFNWSLEAELRQPFFFYQTLINWNHRFSCCNLNVGLYGNYTNGRKHLPNAAAVGIQLGLSFGGKFSSCCRQEEKPVSSSQQECREFFFCDLANWVKEPAFYSPIVLVIADQKERVIPVARRCTSAPTSIPIPDIVLVVGGSYSVDVSGFFSSTAPLTFTATGLPPGSSIDPTLGIISGDNPGDNVNRTITVTATSECGSTSQTFHIFYGNIEL